MKRELKVGDRVKLKKYKRIPNYWSDDMKYLMGKEVTILEVDNDSTPYRVQDIKNPHDFWWMKYSSFDFDTIQEPELNVIL